MHQRNVITDVLVLGVALRGLARLLRLVGRGLTLLCWKQPARSEV
jgi:hypothetical protein